MTTWEEKRQSTQEENKELDKTEVEQMDNMGGEQGGSQHRGSLV